MTGNSFPLTSTRKNKLKRNKARHQKQKSTSLYDQDLKRLYQEMQESHKKSQKESVWQKFVPLRSKGNDGFPNDSWRKGSLRIAYFVSKFITQLQQSNDKLKFKFITNSIFRIINDPASDFNFYLLNGMLKAKPTRITYFSNSVRLIYNSYFPIHLLIKKIGVISPDSYFKMLWDFVILIFIIINIFYIPVQLAFGSVQNNYYDIIFSDIPSVIFIFEILLNFNTAYYHQGIIHKDRDKILMHYLKGDFILDIVVVIPFLISTYNVPYANFTLLLRIRKVSSLFQSIEEILNLRQKYAALVDLTKLIYFVIFVSHFCACAWFYLGNAQFQNNTYSWIEDQNIQNNGKLEQYVFSLYWSTITLLTVGYGDVIPVTPIERIFVIIMALITCGVFGYAINNIGSIFKDMENKRLKLKNQIQNTQLFLKNQNLSLSTQLRIRRYLEFYYKKQNEDDQDIKKLMRNELPSDLQYDYQVELYYNLLQRSNFFKNNISDECLKKLCTKMQEIMYSPEEVIFYKNETQNHLYFIQSGQVNISYETTSNVQQQNKKIVIRSFNEGYIFGEKNFILNNQTQYVAFAKKLSKLAFLEYQDFIDVLQKYPNDYEKYCLLRDNLIYNEYFKKFTCVCEICQSNHPFQNCPFPFFKPNKHKLIRSENESKPNSRLKMDTRGKQKFKLNKQMIKQGALAFCLNEDIIKEDDLTDKALKKLGIIYSKEFTESQSQKESQKIDQSFSKGNSDQEIDDSPKSSSISNSYLMESIKKNDSVYSKRNRSESASKPRQKSDSIQSQSKKRNTEKKISYVYDNVMEVVNRYRYSRLDNSMSEKKMLTFSSKYSDASVNKIETSAIVNPRANSSYESFHQNQIRDEIIKEFDKSKEYQYYFPLFNISFIISKIQKYENLMYTTKNLLKKNAKIKLGIINQQREQKLILRQGTIKV